MTLKDLFRKILGPPSHRIMNYRGFAGVPGYAYCLVCQKKWPEGACPGKEYGAEQKRREAEWWANYREHLANGDSIPQKGNF